MSGVPADVIRVTPAALGDGVAQLRSVDAALHACQRSFPNLIQSVVVGDRACADGLARTARLLQETVMGAGDGIASLARALDAAHGIYVAADATAVPGAQDGQVPGPAR